MKFRSETIRTNTVHQPSAPARVLVFIFLSLTIFFWPSFLERLISLDWRVGNMRLVAYKLEGTFAAAAIVSWLLRKKINAFFSKTFPTRRSLMFAVGFCCFSSLVSLETAEFIAYLFNLPFRMTATVSENSLAQYDPELGWSYVPDRSTIQKFGTDRREIEMHFSSIGSRVRTSGSELHPSVPTMIFVGCSFTMGHGLLYEETVAGVLEAMPDFPLQIVNLGVQGYGTDQALLLLKRYFRSFNTKVVVYGFICDHLNRNANHDRRLFYPRVRFLGTKPLFALRSDGTLYLKELPHRYEELNYSFRLWNAAQIVMSKYGPKPTPDLTRALVQEMRDYVSSHRAIFIVLDWEWDAGCINYDYFRGMNLNLVNLADKAPGDWRTWKVPGDEHPGVEANRYAAGRLLDELKRLNLVPDNSAHVRANGGEG